MSVPRYRNEYRWVVRAAGVTRYCVTADESRQLVEYYMEAGITFSWCRVLVGRCQVAA